MMALKLERIYTQPADLDGYRILVDRFATLEQTVADHLKDGNVILLYGAKDPVHNQAVILKEKLEAGLGL